MAKITGNKNTDSSFLNVLMALKQNTMKDLNVADIAIITQVKDDYNIYCKSLNNSSNIIVATKLSTITDLDKDDIVLILYTNEDFRANLKRIKNGQVIQNTTSSNLHSKNYGVIIGVL